MVRMPDALEASIQKATDLGALGIIVPTVDDALEARDAARYSRYPPVRTAQRRRRRLSRDLEPPGLNYRATINDNMLVTVMIETLEGVAMANEIAATHGVDVIILGNNDLSSFSGWNQHDPRYQDAIIKVHDAALKYGKYYGNAGEQYPDRVHGQRRHAHGPERTRVRRLAAGRSRPWPRDRSRRGAGDRPGARTRGHGAGRPRACPVSGVLLAIDPPPAGLLGRKKPRDCFAGRDFLDDPPAKVAIRHHDEGRLLRHRRGRERMESPAISPVCDHRHRRQCRRPATPVPMNSNVDRQGPSPPGEPCHRGSLCVRRNAIASSSG